MLIDSTTPRFLLRLVRPRRFVPHPPPDLAPAKPVRDALQALLETDAFSADGKPVLESRDETEGDFPDGDDSNDDDCGLILVACHRIS